MKALNIDTNSLFPNLLEIDMNTLRNADISSEKMFTFFPTHSNQTLLSHGFMSLNDLFNNVYSYIFPFSSLKCHY